MSLWMDRMTRMLLSAVTVGALLSGSTVARAAVLWEQVVQPDPRDRTISQSKRYTTADRRSVSESHGSYKTWLDQDVVWIITPEERAEFARLSNDEARDNFIEQFWLRRNPDINAPENAFREEHYARLAYANAHFAAGVPGWSTDRGRAYIVYGKPESIDSHPAGDPARAMPPFELWHYGSVPKGAESSEFEFVDECRCGQYGLRAGDKSEETAPMPRMTAEGGAGESGDVRETALSLGAGVSPPQVIFYVQPEFTKEARKSKLRGNVLVHLVVDELGLPTKVRVVWGLGVEPDGTMDPEIEPRVAEGMNQKAINAVSQYRFKPAMKGGVLVAVELNVQVNFQTF